MQGQSKFSLHSRNARFLAEIGALNILDNDDTPLPLKDIYSKVLEKKNGCSWDSFEAYKHLKALGYAVGRHCIPWIMESAKVNSSCQGALELHEKVHEGSTGVSVITKMFSRIEINEMRPVLEVYPPNNKFKKSSPGSPCFVFCLTSGHPPAKQEIEELEKRCSGSPLKYCNVDNGRISFFSFNRVELPILP